MNLSAFEPYSLLLKLGLVAVLAGSLFVGGCVHGDKARAAKDAKKLIAAASALGDARDSLRAAATTFDQISALTRANADAAEKQIALGESLAKQAKADKAKADKRTAALEKQLQAERAGCMDAGRRICGLPLQ